MNWCSFWFGLSVPLIIAIGVVAYAIYEDLK